MGNDDRGRIGENRRLEDLAGRDHREVQGSKVHRVHADDLVLGGHHDDDEVLSVYVGQVSSSDALSRARAVDGGLVVQGPFPDELDPKDGALHYSSIVWCAAARCTGQGAANLFSG